MVSARKKCCPGGSKKKRSEGRRNEGDPYHNFPPHLPVMRCDLRHLYLSLAWPTLPRSLPFSLTRTLPLHWCSLMWRVRADWCDTAFNYYSTQTCGFMNCPHRQGDINMSIPLCLIILPFFSLHASISLYLCSSFSLTSHHFSISPSILLLISLSPFFSYISQSILIPVSVHMCIHSSPPLSQSSSSLCSSVFAAATSPSPSLAPHTSLFLFTFHFLSKGKSLHRSPTGH